MGYRKNGSAKFLVSSCKNVQIWRVPSDRAFHDSIAGHPKSYFAVLLNWTSYFILQNALLGIYCTIPYVTTELNIKPYLQTFLSFYKLDIWSSQLNIHTSWTFLDILNLSFLLKSHSKKTSLRQCNNRATHVLHLSQKMTLLMACLQRPQKPVLKTFISHAV